MNNDAPHYNPIATRRFNDRANAVRAALDCSISAAWSAVVAADEFEAHEDDIARDQAAERAHLQSFKIKWGQNYRGLTSTDGRFEIVKVTRWILGTRCIDFRLYDNGTKVFTGRQTDCKAHAVKLVAR